MPAKKGAKNAQQGPDSTGNPMKEDMYVKDGFPQPDPQGLGGAAAENVKGNLKGSAAQRHAEKVAREGGETQIDPNEPLPVSGAAADAANGKLKGAAVDATKGNLKGAAAESKKGNLQGAAADAHFAKMQREGKDDYPVPVEDPTFMETYEQDKEYIPEKDEEKELPEEEEGEEEPLDEGDLEVTHQSGAEVGVKPGVETRHAGEGFLGEGDTEILQGAEFKAGKGHAERVQRGIIEGAEEAMMGEEKSVAQQTTQKQASPQKSTSPGRGHGRQGKLTGAAKAQHEAKIQREQQKKLGLGGSPPKQPKMEVPSGRRNVAAH